MDEQDLVLCSANQWIYPLTYGEALLGNKENVVQKSGGAEPLPKLSLDLSIDPYRRSGEFTTPHAGPRSAPVLRDLGAQVSRTRPFIDELGLKAARLLS